MKKIKSINAMIIESDKASREEIMQAVRYYNGFPLRHFQLAVVARASDLKSALQYLQCKGETVEPVDLVFIDMHGVGHTDISEKAFKLCLKYPSLSYIISPGINWPDVLIRLVKENRQGVYGYMQDTNFQNIDVFKALIKWDTYMSGM